MITFPSNIVLASQNAGKLREFQHAFNSINIKLMSQTEFGISDVAETGETFVENAIIKARHAAKFSGVAALADDSGLVVDALAGAPGVYSARYAGQGATDIDNVQKLLQALKDIPQQHRNAHFHCTLVLMRHEKDPEPLICQAQWPGYILQAPQGQQGFGYDPVFYVPSHDCSAAELTVSEKNQISHRGQALKILYEAMSTIGLRK